MSYIPLVLSLYLPHPPCMKSLRVVSVATVVCKCIVSKNTVLIQEHISGPHPQLVLQASPILFCSTDHFQYWHAEEGSGDLGRITLHGHMEYNY